MREQASEARLPPEVQAAAQDPAARVGKYVKTGRLGAGGMGEVWKAWDTDLRRWVALKFLKHGDREERARFKREALTAARLSHPNIATVYEACDEYIAMQYVAGQTLKTAPRTDRRAIVAMLRDAARAVAHAHAHGIVHRDLKPENIMLESGGPEASPSSGTRNAERPIRVYVMDFGLAKPLSARSSLSASGSIVGTPAYMSPEAAQGRVHHLDKRSDVYGLGATLYELLTDRPPFQGANAYDVLMTVVAKEPRRLRKVNPRIDADLDTIVMKCLEKDPARRYAGALELAEDLSRWLSGEPILARAPSSVYRLRKFLTRRKALAASMAALAMLAVVVAALLARWRAARAEAARERAQRSELELYAPLAAELDVVRMKFYQPDFRLTQREFDRYEGLVRKIRAQMQNTGGSPRAWHLIGRCREVLADAPGAEEAYTRALALDAGHSPSLLRRARLQIERALVVAGRTDAESARRAKEHTGAALALVRAAPPCDSLDADLAAAYARVIEEWGAGTYSAAAMLKKWQGEPFVEEFLLLEGISGGRERLLQTATEAVRRMPSFTAAYFWRGVARSDLGDAEGARGDYDRVLEINPRHAWAYNNRANLRADRGDLDGAIADCTRAIEIDARLAFAHLNRGNARLAKGDLEGGIADYTHAIEIDSRFALAYRNRANARSDKGDVDGAIADYTRAIDIDPRDAAAISDRGIARLQRGDPEGAMADFDRAVEIDPRDTLARFNRALLRAGGGDAAGAIADCDRVIEIEPHHVAARVKRGELRRGRGDVDGAIEDLDRALQSDPHHALAHYHRGLARGAKGDELAAAGRGEEAARERARAVTDLETALRLAPPNWAYRSAAERQLSGLKP